MSLASQDEVIRNTFVEFVDLQASRAAKEAGLDESVDAMEGVTEGRVLARVTLTALLTKSWTQMYWTVEGQFLLVFDCRDDYFRDPKSYILRLEMSGLHECSPITTKRYTLFGSTLDHFTLFATRRPCSDGLSLQRMSQLVSTPNERGNYREDVLARFACAPERAKDLRLLRAKLVQMIAVTVREEVARDQERPAIPSTLAVAAVDVVDRASIGGAGNAQDALEEPGELTLNEMLRGKAVEPAVSIPYSDVDPSTTVPTDAEHEAAEARTRKSSVDEPCELDIKPNTRDQGFTVRLPPMFAKSNTSLASQEGAGEDDVHYGYDEG